MRHSRIILIVVFATASAMAQPCFPPPPNMISWWPADGDAVDIVNGNDGMLVGGAGSTSGIVGQAVGVNGNAGWFIEVPDAPNLNFASTSPITVDLWVRRSGTAPVQHILGKRNDCGFSGFDINYQMGFTPSDGLFFGAHQGGVTTGIQLTPNIWTHVAATFDGTTFKFYISGLPVATGSGTLGNTFAVPLRIGTSGTCHEYGQGFSGAVDEIEIFDRALTDAEIWGIYQAGTNGKCRVVDSDGDGVSDDIDACPSSITTATVVIGDCDSGVANSGSPEGCTLADQIAACEAAASTHGQFVSCVAHVTNDAAIRRCAARK